MVRVVAERGKSVFALRSHSLRVPTVEARGRDGEAFEAWKDVDRERNYDEPELHPE
jgi:hypothetical protein